ncbi:RING/FYVE/PHD zinc finger superfamily protein [Actinidia rufa]|uniref:RING/FYVE/PHD zinc finger superfamily protein n=1 Tax=Actinidia rufa TaxID=165716 RepID=A0A7J0FY17_9ERIC|nr:RING/FYVE/PHD zinc finger superfamily protein [Actinidia rufa]
MGDHLVLRVDRLITPKSLQSLEGDEVPGASGEGSCSHTAGPSTSTIDIKDVEEHDDADEQEPLIQMVECRICQEEDSIKNLEVPCACNGSLKYAHRKCVQRWCNEKGDVTCEICHQAYNKQLHLVVHKLKLLRLMFCNKQSTNIATQFMWPFLATGCWFSSPMLHYGLGCQYIATSKAKTQEAAAAHTATEVAFMIQAGQHRGLQFTVAPAPAPAVTPGPTVNPHQEPVQ